VQYGMISNGTRETLKLTTHFSIINHWTIVTWWSERVPRISK